MDRDKLVRDVDSLFEYIGGAPDGVVDAVTPPAAEEFSPG